MERQKQRLGELLIDKGIIDKHQLQSALARQEKWDKRLGETLIDMGFISENTLMKALSTHFNIPSINLSKVDIPEEVINLVSKELVEKNSLLPIAIKTVNNRKRLVCVTSDPSNLEAVDEVQFLTGMQILVMVTTVSNLQLAIRKFYYGDSKPGAYFEDRSGISMIAPKPGDSRMEVIRDGDAEVISMDPEQQADEEQENSESIPAVDRTDSQKEVEDAGIEEELAGFGGEADIETEVVDMADLDEASLQMPIATDSQNEQQAGESDKNEPEPDTSDSFDIDVSPMAEAAAAKSTMETSESEDAIEIPQGEIEEPSPPSIAPPKLSGSGIAATDLVEDILSNSQQSLDEIVQLEPQPTSSQNSAMHEGFDLKDGEDLDEILGSNLDHIHTEGQESEDPPEVRVLPEFQKGSERSQVAKLTQVLQDKSILGADEAQEVMTDTQPLHKLSELLVEKRLLEADELADILDPDTDS